MKKRKGDVNHNAVEAAEIIACNTHVREQIAEICPQDRAMLGEGSLERFFTIAYWRNKYLDLLLDNE